MVGRAVDDLYPRERRATRASRRSRVDGSRRVRDVRAAPRRDSRHRRAGRRRPHAAAARDLRPRAREERTHQLGAVRGPAGAARSLAAGHGHAQRGPRRRRACARLERRRQPDAARGSTPLGPGFTRPAVAAGRGAAARGSIGSASAARHPRQTVARALRRQPAESRGRAVAAPRRRRAGARRADARHRRREQGADLRSSIDRAASRPSRVPSRGRRCSSSAAICRNCSASAIALR